jgi:hypothetical protein
MILKKNFVSLFLLLGLGCNLAAQKIDVSSPVKLSSRVDKVKIVGKNQDGYVVRLSGDEESFQVYGNDMRLVFAKKLDLRNGDGFVQHIQLYKSGGVVYFLRSEGRTTLLMAQVLNGSFQNAGAPIAVDTFPDNTDITQANLRVKQSANQAYTVFYAPVFSGKTVSSMQIVCVDKNVNRIYKRFPSVEKPEKEMEFAKCFVDTNATTLLVFNDGRNTMKVSVWGKSDSSYKSFSVPFAKKIFSDPYIELDNKNNQLLFAGFYDNEVGMSEAAAYGFFYKTYDYTIGSLKSESLTAFPDSFIQALTGRLPSQSNNRLYTFAIRKIVQRIDGGVLIVAESSIKDRREEPVVSLSSINPYTSYRTINTFQYNDIIAFSINASGNLEWNSIMRKKQYSEEDNGFNASFACVNLKDQLRFIFPEDISFSSDIDEFALKSTGEFKKQMLFEQEDKDVFLVPKLAKQVALNEVLIPSIKKNELRILRVKY